MSFERSLIPANYPRYGRAVDEANARLIDVPVPVGDMWNPWKAPAVVLPFLAWALSVDVWVEEWPEEKKRAVIAASFDLHRHKGTLGGIKDHVALLGSEVTLAVTPPAASYLSPDISEEERLAFLADLPQLRLYEQWTGESDSEASFWNEFAGEYFTDADGRSLLFEVALDLSPRTGEFAELFDRGQITPLSRNAVKLVGDHYEVMLTGIDVFGIYGGGADFHDEPFKFFVDSTATDRWYSFKLTESTGSARLLYSFAIHAGGAAVNTEPDFVAEKGFDFASVFCDEPIGDTGSAAESWYQPSTAGTRLYRVVYFYKAGRQTIDTRALSFLNDARFGIDNFTAELSTIIPGYRPPWIADDFIDGYFYDADLTALWRTLDAMVSAKAERDVVLVRTSLFKPMSIGQRLVIGTPLIMGSLFSSWR